MELLTERYTDRLTGVLSCYDRIVITGTLPGGKAHIRKEAVVAEVLKTRGDHPGLVHIIPAMETCTAVTVAWSACFPAPRPNPPGSNCKLRLF